MWRNKHYKQYYGYYKRDKRNLIKFGIVFAVLLITMYFMHFIVPLDNKGFYASVIAFIASWYFIMDVVEVIRIGIRAQVNDYGKRCILFHRYSSCAAFLFSAISLIISLLRNIDLNCILIIYLMLVFPGLLHFIMLFMFTEDYYYTDGFRIYYSEIDQIEVEDEVPTVGEAVCVCRLMKAGQVVGYDRMVVQDYITLKNRICKG